MRHDVPKVVPIEKITTENSIARTFVLPLSIGARPGQFVNLWIPRVDEKPFSVALDDGKKLHLAIAEVGSFTKKLFALEVGDKVGVRGPYGKTFEAKPGSRLALIGGGYGAAPLYFFAREMVKKRCRVDVILGARRKDLLLYVNRFKKLPNTTVHVATDDGSMGHHGYNTQILEQLIAKARKGQKAFDLICTVGPELMMKRVSDIALAAKIPAQISVERYMKCGFGVCGNCCVDGEPGDDSPAGWRMCTEGTIVDSAFVRKMTDFGKYHRGPEGQKVEF